MPFISSLKKLTVMTDIIWFLPGTTRQEASNLDSWGVPSPKWRPQQWSKGSCNLNIRTPPCLPGRSTTGQYWSEYVTKTVCPASAPSTGRTKFCFQNVELRSKIGLVCLYRIIRSKVKSESWEARECFSLLHALLLKFQSHFSLIICHHGNQPSL